ncbi:MAG: hypothetical protein U0575_09500 [Phycisphaerales bacterium]
MNSNRISRLSALICAAVAAGLCGPAGGDVVTEWNAMFQETIRQVGGFPCPISRAGAMLFTSMYDAVNSVTPTHEPYLQNVPCPPGTSAEAAAATAAHKILSTVYTNPIQTSQYNALLASQLAAIPDGPDKEAGIALGLACASQCIVARTGDGSTNNTPYVLGGNPGDWAPTFPDYTGPASPNWPLVTPWCMTSGDQFRLPGPAGYTSMAELLASPEYAEQYNEVKELGALFSKTRTEYETETALFWANDRNGTFKPPGHLLYMTQAIGENQGNTLYDNARLLALVALGMADAGIAAWDCKYSTDIDLWRPITAIWNGDSDGNPATQGDPDWYGLSYDRSILVFTPPFPAWVSGHATFGAVTSAVIHNFYHTDNLTFTITSDDTPGVYRTYDSLDFAAKENGRSRIFLGVHYSWDADDGYTIGTNLGNYIGANFLRRVGDLNGDDVVDGADLGILLASWGGTGNGDLNRDGTVDGADLGLLLSVWG